MRELVERVRRSPRAPPYDRKNAHGNEGEFPAVSEPVSATARSRRQFQAMLEDSGPRPSTRADREFAREIRATLTEQDRAAPGR